jgi:membrane protein
VNHGGLGPPGRSGPQGRGGTGERDAPVLGWRGRLEALQRAVLRQPIAVGVMDIMRAYDRGGGGMLSAGLSYFALFTVVPALLLFVSLLGVLVESRELRNQLVSALVDQLDPIRDVAMVVIDGLADSGRTGTIIGVIGLLWGASGFYGALQGAMQRMFPGPGTRDFLQTRVRGVLAVVLILGSMLGAVVLIFILPLVTEWLTARCRDLVGLQAPLIAQACAIDLAGIGGVVAVLATMAIAFLAALLVYVAVPPDGPSLHQALWPAVVVGVLIGLLTSLFGWIAPLLARQWLALGIAGSVFIALVWFNLVFQVLLYGAAFARLRRDRARTLSGPPLL